MSVSSNFVSFALERSRMTLVSIVVVAVEVIPTRFSVLLPTPHIISCSVSLFSWLYSSICHDVSAHIELIIVVFCNPFEFLIRLKCKVNCDYVKNDQSYYYTDYKRRLLLYKSSCSMGVLFDLLSPFDFSFAFFISYFFSRSHIVSRFSSLFPVVFLLTPISFMTV